MKNLILKIISLASIVATIGCSDFLDEKSDSKLATPETLVDNQALLDRSSNLLDNNSISGEISCDDIYITDSDYKGIGYEADKRLYTWQPNLVSNPSGNDWESCYYRINICNTVLDNLKQYHVDHADNVRGQALAIRASIYLEASQIWSLAYDKSTSNSNMGMPLRLNSDMNIPSVRSTLEQTYQQILKDLHEVITLLPDHQVSVVRASKVTALAYLARTYLYMGDYQNALLYANQVLKINNTLMDFNSLKALDSYPIKDMNIEVLLSTSLGFSPVISTNTAKIDKDLYASYNNNDLRKSIYFKLNSAGDVLFKGNYTGSSVKSSAIAIDEIYLIAAESYAELDNVTNAMKVLNDLLVKRWKQGTFTNVTASNKADALEIIAQERRKELLFRGIRWSDLKRYNRDRANINLSRTIGGKTYVLPANDLRYAIAIPEDIIKMTGMSQNPR